MTPKDHLPKLFAQLAETWKKETAHESRIAAKSMHQAYQRIIGMGERAIRLILQDLDKNGPNDWFWALSAITGENPITADMAGNMEAMTRVWLQWGRDEGYIGVKPGNGGCWFCEGSVTNNDDEVYFSVEFDTYLHKHCLDTMPDDPDDRETAIIRREIEAALEIARECQTFL